MANRNFANGGKIMMMETAPVIVTCNFIVDSTNGNGLGIRSLKGATVANVFMHTSATPAGGNPNPASGTIVLQLQDNYNRSLSGFRSIVSPVSGTPIKIDNSDLTAGVAYIITTLGTATAAQWHALGVSAGVTPAVGVAFIAASVGAGSNTLTSRVMETGAAGSGIASIESVGDSNLSIAPDGLQQSTGAQFILQCRDYAGAIAAPVNGTVISMSLMLSNSSVQVQGQ